MPLLAMTIAAAAGAAAPDYEKGDAWLCRPGRADVCAANLDATRIDPDGTAHVVPAPAARPRDIDCFYVYPTASLDAGGNSDLIPGKEEEGMTIAQFAPFRSVCRTFAPVYRQVTLTGLRRAMATGKLADAGDFDLAYRDVLAAWRSYLARDNGGRPFVLVGHSQGAMMLKRLIAGEIDGKPVQRRLVSAILPGTAIEVPVGKDVGGDFKAVPLCRADGQTGCVVTWGAYRAGVPLPADALFGRAGGQRMEAGCTNPARLAGGEAPLDPILGFPWWQGGYARFAPPAEGWTVNGQAVTTRFVRMPGLLRAQCTRQGPFHYLAVAVDPARAKGIGDIAVGTAAVGDAAFPGWGFHVIDMAVVEGDLLTLVRRQHAAWRADGERR